MASSSSSCPSITLQFEYDVFLSFRGEDTRQNFTSHLSGALRRKGLVFFIDDCGLKKGDDISPTLLKAIEQSKISVVIFSKDYASSRWCLDELVKILECKKKNGQMVIPVFYHVDPSHVRHQTGNFEVAFVKHEQRYKNMKEKVQNWRSALTEAANLSGFSSSSENWSEYEFVENIVGDILQKLSKMHPLPCCEGLVGMISRFEEIKSLLCLGSSDSHIVGIWGMGGLGKTTLAEVVYQQLSLSHEFEGHCFIEKFSEKAKQSDGLPLLSRQLMSQIFGEGNLNIDTSNSMNQFNKCRLQRKRVFIVFDDVNDVEHLQKLIGGVDQLAPGSRVIITTRDKQVLHNFDVEKIYEVKRLNYNEALQLFINHAFKQNHPSEDFLKLSCKVVNYASGNPLALKVLGASLYKKIIQFWESALKKLKKVPNCKIYDVLKVSYDGLDDHEVKNIFLDIAFFFRGENKDHVEKIMDDCYSSAHSGLEVLVDKSLITISWNKIEIHDLLQEMGWEIVREESLKPAKRSRLCNPDEIYDMLKDNIGINAKGLVLDMSKIPALCPSPEAFTNMHNLQFLRVYESQPWRNVANTSMAYLPQGLSYLPNKLRYLYWDGYPLKTLPIKFSLENLVVLKLPNNNLERLWVWKEHAPTLRLKSLDLRYSLCLTSIPDLSNAKELEEIDLTLCKSLVDISSSIQGLDSLRSLKLNHCKSLQRFSNHVHFKSLDKLDLFYCTNLSEFPNVSGSIKSLILNGAPIKEVPSSIGCIENLKLIDCKNPRSSSRINLSNRTNRLSGPANLDLSDCKNLEIIPRSINNCQNSLKQISQLCLRSCKLTEISENLCFLSSLEDLDLRNNNFKSLPASIKQLSKLKYISLSDCHMLQSLPELPSRLRNLDVVNCEQLQSLPEFLLNDFKEVDDASELEIEESRHYRSFSNNDIEFSFANCPKLNGNASIQFLANAPLRFQSMAATSLEYRHQDMEWDGIPRIKICLPGSEIPDWVSYQSPGSSFSIDLSQDWFNKNFIGFALCAIIQFEEGFYFDDLYVECEYNFETNYGDRVEFISGLNVITSVSGIGDRLLEGDHVMIMYDSCFDAKLRQGEHTAASFEFKPVLWSNYENEQELLKGCKVKCCGAHPLYSRPSEAQPSICTKASATTSRRNKKRKQNIQ